MSYAKKNMKNVTGSIIGVIVVSVIAIWQFYLFVTFKNVPGVQGGMGHLWWAIAMAVLACGTAFLVFSVFVRHDTDDDLHITFTPGG